MVKKIIVLSLMPIIIGTILYIHACDTSSDCDGDSPDVQYLNIGEEIDPSEPVTGVDTYRPFVEYQKTVVSGPETLLFWTEEHPEPDQTRLFCMKLDSVDHHVTDPGKEIFSTQADIEILDAETIGDTVQLYYRKGKDSWKLQINRLIFDTKLELQSDKQIFSGDLTGAIDGAIEMKWIGNCYFVLWREINAGNNSLRYLKLSQDGAMEMDGPATILEAFALYDSTLITNGSDTVIAWVVSDQSQQYYHEINVLKLGPDGTFNPESSQVVVQDNYIYSVSGAADDKRFFLVWNRDDVNGNYPFDYLYGIKLRCDDLSNESGYMPLARGVDTLVTAHKGDFVLLYQDDQKRSLSAMFVSSEHYAIHVTDLIDSEDSSEIEPLDLLSSENEIQVVWSSRKTFQFWNQISCYIPMTLSFSRNGPTSEKTVIGEHSNGTGWPELVSMDDRLILSWSDDRNFSDTLMDIEGSSLDWQAQTSNQDIIHFSEDSWSQEQKLCSNGDSLLSIMCDILQGGPHPSYDKTAESIIKIVITIPFWNHLLMRMTICDWIR